MASFNRTEAQCRLLPVLEATRLRFADVKYRLDHPNTTIHAYRTIGLTLSPHKKTWERKRPDKWMIRLEYYYDEKIIFKHVEPWVSFPTDRLVAKLCLLPVEVNK